MEKADRFLGFDQRVQVAQVLAVALADLDGGDSAGCSRLRFQYRLVPGFPGPVLGGRWHGGVLSA
jgi:hypothetical protein